MFFFSSLSISLVLLISDFSTTINLFNLKKKKKLVNLLLCKNPILFFLFMGFETVRMEAETAKCDNTFTKLIFQKRYFMAE